MLKKLATALVRPLQKAALYLIPCCVIWLVYHHTPDNTAHGRPLPVIREVREKPQESEV